MLSGTAFSQNYTVKTEVFDKMVNEVLSGRACAKAVRALDSTNTLYMKENIFQKSLLFENAQEGDLRRQEIDVLRSALADSQKRERETRAKLTRNSKLTVGGLVLVGVLGVLLGSH